MGLNQNLLYGEGGGNNAWLNYYQPSTEDATGSNFWHDWSQAFLRGGQGLIDSTGVDDPDNYVNKVYESIYPDSNPLEGAPSLGDPFDRNLEESQMISDAKTFGDLKGKNVEEQLEWLINNDPDNKTGWMELLLGLRAERENVQQARDYEKYMSDTRVQRTAKDLEAAGINPILAYQYLSNSAGSVGAAGLPDSSVSTNATSRANTRATTNASNQRALIGIVTAIIAGMFMLGKSLI